MELSLVIHLVPHADDPSTILVTILAKAANSRIIETETHKFTPGLRRAFGPNAIANWTAFAVREMLMRHEKKVAQP